MYCRFCGKEVQDDINFCNHCGKNLSKRADNVPIIQKQQNKSTRDPIKTKPTQKNKAKTQEEKVKKSNKSLPIILGAVVLIAIVLSGIKLLGFLDNGRDRSSKYKGNGPFVVEREMQTESIKVANQAIALTLRYYIKARLKTEEFIMMDPATITEEEIISKIDELVSIWENAEILTSKAEDITDEVLKSLEVSSLKEINNPNISSLLFSSPVYAEAIRSVEWAEALTEQYDALRGGQRYSQLAKQLGTDTKTAVEEMRLAQKIIFNGAMLEGEEAIVKEYTKSINTLEAYKTGSKVGLFVGATIATGGGTLPSLAASSMTLAQTTAVVVGGVDCIIDVGKTGSSIILGEDHKVVADFEKAGKVFAPISTVVGLCTLDPKNLMDQVTFVGGTFSDIFSKGGIIVIDVDKLLNGDSQVSIQKIDKTDKTESEVKAELEKLEIKAPSEKGVSIADLLQDYKIEYELALETMNEHIGKLEKALAEIEKQNQEDKSKESEDVGKGKQLIFYNDNNPFEDIKKAINESRSFNQADYALYETSSIEVDEKGNFSFSGSGPGYIMSSKDESTGGSGEWTVGPLNFQMSGSIDLEDLKQALKDDGTSSVLIGTGEYSHRMDGTNLYNGLRGDWEKAVYTENARCDLKITYYAPDESITIRHKDSFDEIRTGTYTTSYDGEVITSDYNEVKTGYVNFTFKLRD